METKKILWQAAKKIKKTVMDTNSNPNRSERSKHADTIVRNHVIWSMGAGLIPVLIADVFAVSALQLDMIRQLSRVYDVNFSETQGKAIVTSLTSSTLARVGAGSLVKLVPGVGSLIGGATVSLFAGASTYALGQVFRRHFESGGTILDFDPSRLKKMYREQFEKGKTVVKDLRKNKSAKKEAEEAATRMYEEQVAKEKVELEAQEEPTSTPNDAIAQFKQLAELRDSGILSEEEFQAMKKKVIGG